MRSRVLIVCLFALITTAPAVAAAGDEAPAWLQQAAALKVPTYEKNVWAVVLRNEQNVVVSEDGRTTTTTNYAVRILTHEGKDEAVAIESYLTNSGKVREINAWLIRPNGFVKKYGKDQTIDRISDPNDIYNEFRLKIIDASVDADAGVVFGYQSITEDKPLFNQDRWVFQDYLPALISRYSLNLPAGWRATSVTFNHETVEPSVSGSNYTWELRDLTPIRFEPASPKIINLVPRLAISYFQPDTGPARGVRTFENWAQVSRWATEIHDPQAVADQAITSKARELTMGAKTELERIRAIGTFVQNLQYISVDIGVGKGNGYRPHAAAQVLAKAYGDCKDKANLMRTMLQTLNIPSYPVAIYSGNPTHVREEWPSPDQFNHIIIAVKVSDETQAATVISHSKLGRLLIFDATDDNTKIGDLPDHEQGSWALLIAGEVGQLMRMPTLPPEANLIERQTDVVLNADGRIEAILREKAIGQAAASRRGQFRRLSRTDFLSGVENWVTRGATAAKVAKVNPRDGGENGDFDLDIDFSASSYAQIMQGRLMVFKPTILSRREELSFTEPNRKHPISLEAGTFKETVRVKLPAEFSVDELPDAVKLNTSFGSYQANYEVKDGQLVFTRALLQKSILVPADQYSNVRSFFERVRAAEQAPVVLARK